MGAIAMQSSATKLLTTLECKSFDCQRIPRFRNWVTLPLAFQAKAGLGQSHLRRAESGAESMAEGSLVALVLQALARGPLSKSEIAQALGRDSVSRALNRTIRQLLDRDEIGYALPDTPNSRLQKYRLLTQPEGGH
jgi:hypothetical protein